MKSLLAITALLLASTSYASFFEECELQAVVGKTSKIAQLNGSVDSYETVTSFEIIGAVALSGHTDCSNHIGETKVLKTTGQTLKADDNLILLYSHMNDDTPEGLKMNEEWKISDAKGLLTTHCSQVSRELPRFEVELRMPSGMVTTDRIYHNVIIRKDGEILERGENIEETINPRIASLHYLKLGTSRIVMRISNNAASFEGELRMEDGLKKRIFCQRK